MSWQALALWLLVYVNLGYLGWCLAEKDWSGTVIFLAIAMVGTTRALEAM